MAKPPPRLFLTDGPRLEGDAKIPLVGPQWHYLHTVLRMEEGAQVLVFNGQDGEWAGEIEHAAKRAGTVRLTAQTRAQPAPSKLILLFSPLKKDPTDLIVQKATELGVGRLQPVITARTVLKGKLRLDRLTAIAAEAAEQCERLDVPELAEPISLDDALEALDDGTTLIFCDEAGDDDTKRWGGASGRATPIGRAFSRMGEGASAGPAAILIGPEGGFSPEEREALRGRPDAVPVSLGPRILKAETAVIAALAVWQALVGDSAGPGPNEETDNC